MLQLPEAVLLGEGLGDGLALPEESPLGEEDEVAPVLGDEYLRQVALQGHQRLITVPLTLEEEKSGKTTLI